MRNQGDERDEQKRGNHQGAVLTSLVAGLGIGVIIGILLAPQSGEDTREWIATKYKDGVDSVNTRVRQTRQHVAELIDRGQHQVNDTVSQVSDAVDAGREAFKKAKSAGV
jgi:gas vesicle protein